MVQSSHFAVQRALTSYASHLSNFFPQHLAVIQGTLETRVDPTAHSRHVQFNKLLTLDPTLLLSTQTPIVPVDLAMTVVVAASLAVVLVVVWRSRRYWMKIV